MDAIEAYIIEEYNEIHIDKILHLLLFFLIFAFINFNLSRTQGHQLIGVGNLELVEGGTTTDLKIIRCVFWILDFRK